MRQTNHKLMSFNHYMVEDAIANAEADSKRYQTIDAKIEINGVTY